MCKDDCINSRKNELREAICECREEKRHIQNIIIAVATTMLTCIPLSSSNTSNTNAPMTYQKTIIISQVSSIKTASWTAVISLHL